MNTTTTLDTETLIDDATSVSGMPADRQARLAARRAFVEMKHLFMRAVEPMSDRKGQWLKEKVRLSSDPMDLWLLRGPVMAALQQSKDRGARALRAELYRGIDSVFPEAFGQGGVMPTLPPLSDTWALLSETRQQATGLRW